MSVEILIVQKKYLTRKIAILNRKVKPLVTIRLHMKQIIIIFKLNRGNHKRTIL